MNQNRRAFIRSAAMGVVSFALVNPILISKGQNISTDTNSPDEIYRPRFHFTPPKGWTNDPCGLFYDDGYYYMHYLWNPDLRGWGQQWAQITSKDLIHWKEDGISVKCEGSGSAIVDINNTSGFGTGKNHVMVLVFSEFTKDGQIVGIAYSNDRGRTWTKHEGNPILRHPDDNKDFRDPRVFWHSPTSKWILVLSRGYTKPGNMYESTNLKEWKLLGEVPNGECPDLFELPVEGHPSETKWVYVAGDYPMAPNGVGVKYFIGDFDGRIFGNRSGTNRFGGNFFVGQSFSQIKRTDGRRIWIGWKWLPEDKYGTLGPWSGGIHTLPVVLSLWDIQGTGIRLCQNPAKELQSLRYKHFHFDSRTIMEENSLLSDLKIQGDLLEFTAIFQLDSAAEFGIQLRKGAKGHCTLGYRSASNELFFIPMSGKNGFVQTLTPNEKTVKLHVLLDRSVIDVFGNDGITWNCEFFKTDPDCLGIELYSKGGKVRLLSMDLWKLKL